MTSKNAEPIKLRPFCPEDQHRVRELILKGLARRFNHLDTTLNPDLDDIQRAYCDRGNSFILAEIGGLLVGTGALVMLDNSLGRIVRMSVLQQYQRLGIGRSILKFLADEARKRNCRGLLVETNYDWEDAIAFYKHFGFIPSHYDKSSVHMFLELN